MENKNREHYVIGKLVNQGLSFRVFEVTVYRWFEEVGKLGGDAECGGAIQMGFCKNRLVEYVSRGYLRDNHNVYNENSVIDVTDGLRHGYCHDMTAWEQTGNVVEEGIFSYISYQDSEFGETFVEQYSVKELKSMVKMLGKIIAFEETKQ